MCTFKEKKPRQVKRTWVGSLVLGERIIMKMNTKCKTYWEFSSFQRNNKVVGLVGLVTGTTSWFCCNGGDVLK